MHRLIRSLLSLVLSLALTLPLAGCATVTSTSTPTSTPTLAPTATVTPFPSSTPTPTPTRTPTLTPTRTPTSTPTLTPTSSPTPAPTSTPAPTPTPLPATAANPLAPWEPLPVAGLPGAVWINDIAFATADTVFIVAADDLYRSTDAGQTWSPSLDLVRGIRTVVASPSYAADRTLFAADGRSLLLRSTDGGETWQELVQIALVGGASDADLYLSISPAYPADPTLWAVIEGGMAYRSTDGGLTWERFDPGLTLPARARLVPGPDYPADQTLTAVDLDAIAVAHPPADPLAYPLVIAESGGMLLLGTTHGLYRSTDGGSTWAETGSGLPPSPVSVAAVAADGTLYAAVERDYRLFRLPPSGTRWSPLSPLPDGDFGPPPVYGITVSARPVLVVTTSDAFLISRDDGLTWERMAGEGLPPDSYSRFALLIPPDFAADGVAYLTYRGHLYRTADGGDTWARVEGLSGVKRLLLSPDGRLIALTTGAAYEWEQGEGAWLRHSAGLGFGDEPLTARFVTDRLAVAVMDGLVFLSEDGGRNWTRLGESTLEEAYDYLISPRFDADYALYAISASGVRVSTDAGRTWVAAGAGLPSCDYYGGPTCDLRLFGGLRSDGGYTLYAALPSRLWAARAIR